MTLSETFVASFVVGFSGAIMPGPLLALNLSQTPRHGWLTGPLITLGHGVAEILVVILLSFGLASLASGETSARIVAVVGGVALILMGILMARDIFQNRVNYSQTHAQPDSKGSLIAIKGFSTTFTNPYWFVWWGTIGASFVLQSKPLGVAGPTAVYVGHILADLIWYTTVAIIVWSGRQLLAGTGLKILLGACAVFLIYLGCTFTYKGVVGAISL